MREVHTLWSNREARAGSIEAFPLRKERPGSGWPEGFSDWDLDRFPMMRSMSMKMRLSAVIFSGHAKPGGGQRPAENCIIG